MEQLKIKKQAMIQALTESLGIVTTACRTVGIDRSTHYAWMRTDKDYQLEVEDMAEVALDFVEGKLHELIAGVIVTSPKSVTYRMPPNIRAVMFYLKTKGKKRGYTERADMEPIADKKEIISSSAPDEANLPDEPQWDESVTERPIIDDSHHGNRLTAEESKAEEASPTDKVPLPTLPKPAPLKMINIKRLPEHVEILSERFSSNVRRWVLQTIKRPYAKEVSNISALIQYGKLKVH